jgi:hypothetical protein
VLDPLPLKHNRALKLFMASASPCHFATAKLKSWLAKHGKVLLVVAAQGPIRGLSGMFVEGTRRYYWKGECAPRLGDLAYSEMLLFSTGPALRR